jgi:probable HAF family extracellular repeat protein
MARTIRISYVAVFTMLVAMALLGVLSGSSGASSEDYTVTDLGTLGGDYSYAYALNDTGQIVGFSYVSPSSIHAFLYKDGQMRDLNALIPQDSGWTLEFAWAINTAGQIVGEGAINGQ